MAVDNVPIAQLAELVAALEHPGVALIAELRQRLEQRAVDEEGRDAESR